MQISHFTVLKNRLQGSNKIRSVYVHLCVFYLYYATSLLGGLKIRLIHRLRLYDHHVKEFSSGANKWMLVCINVPSPLHHLIYQHNCSQNSI